jgi:hypothetical protein
MFACWWQDGCAVAFLGNDQYAPPVGECEMRSHVYAHRLKVAMDYRRNECDRVGGAYMSTPWLLKTVFSFGRRESPVLSFSGWNGGRFVWENAT